MDRRDKILKCKIIFTILLVLVYSAIRKIPLYSVDVAAYVERDMDAQNVLLSAIGGDSNQYSVFALGIAPYMMANIIVSIISAVAGIGTKRKVSPKKIGRIILDVTLIVATAQAVLRVRAISFAAEGYNLYIAQGVAAIELITGAILVMYLCDYNKKYGIGGQTAIIFTNIIDGIIGDIAKRVEGQNIKNLLIIFGICIAVFIVILNLENGEFRMPVQRVSIHNIYADKNYQAVKLNPIGIMPIMFSTAVFMIPTIIIQILCAYFPDNEKLAWINSNMSMTKGLGMIVYLLCIYLLNIGFSFIIVNPADMADRFLKGGDSVVGVRSGRETKKYLTKVVFTLSFFSSTVMCLCIGIPLYLQLIGLLDSSLSMLPVTFMLITGLATSLYQEYESLKSYDSYKPFF